MVDHLLLGLNLIGGLSAWLLTKGGFEVQMAFKQVSDFVTLFLGHVKSFIAHIHIVIKLLILISYVRFQGEERGIFIGPESDHWQCLSLTDSLTHSLTDCRLINMIYVTLVCEDASENLLRLLLLLMLVMRIVLATVCC